VRSLARPEANTTGFSNFGTELDGRRQELLIEAVPGIRRMAALAEVDRPSQRRLETLQEMARGRGVELSVFRVPNPEDIAGAIDAAKAAGAAAVNMLSSAVLYSNRDIIIDRATAVRLPAMYRWPEAVEAGGLIGYGPHLVELYRDIWARQLAKLLRGAKPADLPIEQPTRFALAINLRTAQAIGHSFPSDFLARADKVIE
jgi:putative tryptophan/tyrosine transport system substrate-binding protein